MKVAHSRLWLPVVILVLGAVFVFWMNQAFTDSAAMRDIFCGTNSAGEVLGRYLPVPKTALPPAANLPDASRC